MSGRDEVHLRLHTIEGHLRAVRRMIEEQEAPPDSLHQILAVQASLHAVGALILRRYLLSCGLRGMREEDPKAIEKVLDAVSAHL